MVSDNRKKKPRSYRLGCCGEGIASAAEVAVAALGASGHGPGSPAIHEGPAHLRRQARKAWRPSAFLPVAPRRDLLSRRPGVDGRDKPGHDGKGSTNDQQNGRPTDNAIKAKIRALVASAVVGKELGAWRRWWAAPSRRHGRSPPGHLLKAQRIYARQARKALRPSAFLPAAPRRDSSIRRPVVDGRDKPRHDGKGSMNEQQTGRRTDNAIRAKIRALIALAVVGKELGSMARGGGRRHQGVMAGLVPAIHASP